MQTLVRPWAVLGREPFASHLDKAEPDEPVQTCRPEDISVWWSAARPAALQDDRRLAARLIVTIDDWR